MFSIFDFLSMILIGNAQDENRKEFPLENFQKKCRIINLYFLKLITSREEELALNNAQASQKNMHICYAVKCLRKF